MKQAIVYQKMRNVIESCNTHIQLNVSKKMIDKSLYGSYLVYGDVYHNDLMDRYYRKWNEIGSIEDEELLEKMNAKTETIDKNK